MTDGVVQLDLTPMPHTLAGIMAQSLTFEKALCEHLDNALDADATSVTIAVERAGRRQRLVISDNGKGCPAIAAFATLGQHVEKSSTRSGRYGVGGTEASLWLGGEDSTLDVTSVHEGVQRVISVEWSRVLKNDSWGWSAPAPVPADAKSGTVIVITPLDRQPADWDRLISNIGYLYSPGIEEGRQITICRGPRESRPVPVRAWRLPRLKPGAVDTDIRVGDLRAHVECGITRDVTENTRAGLTYVNGFRVIPIPRDHGCGDHGTRLICGRVTLIGRWPLTKHKDDISAHRIREELGRQVGIAIAPILALAAEESHKFDTKELEGAIAGYLRGNAGGADAKAKRESPKNRSKKPKPERKGGPHMQAEKEQDGNRFPGGNGRGFKVEFHNLGDPRIGELDGRTLKLNLDCRFVTEAQTENNIKALAALCGAILAVHRRPELRRGQSSKLAFGGAHDTVDERTLTENMAAILSPGARLDGAVVTSESTAITEQVH